MNKSVISAIAGFSAGLLIAVFIKKDFTECAKETLSPVNNAGVIQPAAPDTNEIKLLKEKIAQLESINKPANIKIPAKADTPPVECNSIVNSVVQALDKKNEIMQELQKAGSSNDYDVQLQQNFANEARNPIWASNTETELYNALKADVTTQSITVSTVQCKTKTCELSIPADNSTRNKIVGAISSDSFLKLIGFNNPTTKSTINIRDGEIKLYISTNP